jgi:hypothetical protein
MLSWCNGGCCSGNRISRVKIQPPGDEIEIAENHESSHCHNIKYFCLSIRVNTNARFRAKTRGQARATVWACLRAPIDLQVTANPCPTAHSTRAKQEAATCAASQLQQHFETTHSTPPLPPTPPAHALSPITRARHRPHTLAQIPIYTNARWCPA